MAVFVVISDAPNAALGQKIERLYPNAKSYKINDCSWLLNADKLTRAVADELELTQGSQGRAVVLRASNSGSGWQAKSLWEWLTLQGESA